MTLLFPQGSQKRPFPLFLCLKVQYYVENGRLIRYVLRVYLFIYDWGLHHLCVILFVRAFFVYVYIWYQ